MQKTVALVVLVLLVGAGLFFTFFWGDTAAPIAPEPNRAAPETTATVAEREAAAAPGSVAVAPAATHRTEVVTVDASVLDDPEIQAGLSGFRGRVVTHDQIPVGECGVRFYRAAMDVVLPDTVDPFADGPSLEPQYVAGETRTQENGTFLLTGLWPRAVFIMFAGIGTDTPVHQIITRTPSPGEIVDLGDVVLPDAGVIVGTVLGPEGEPLAGALVRAADIPGTLAGFFPVERFDPEGALLLRVSDAPVEVLEMPAWVKPAFEQVPIPTTRSATDGSFRLVGVVPGSNLLAVTAKDCVAHVKPSVMVRAGEEENVGEVKLREGEELFGKVLDTAGQPVVDAEVVAGSTITMAPVDLARRVGKTNAKGEFTALGFSPGKVTVAARRSPADPWVLAEPQPILGDVVVTLPATFAARVKVLDPAGNPVASPRLRLLRGEGGEGAAELAAFGFVPPVDLTDRLHHDAEHELWRIDGLKAGDYTLVGDAPGLATSFQGFKLGEADVELTLQLHPKREFLVRVVDHEERPIRNAVIYAKPKGHGLYDIPLNCGRTNAEGRLAIDRFQAEELRVSAEHPKWGFVHGEATLEQELVLRLVPPGSIEGVLSENGAPPEAGKFTVTVEWRRNDGPRGPLEVIPRLVSAGADGTFRVAALQPGSYRLSSLDSLEAVRSPGSMFLMMTSARMGGEFNRERQTIEVVSGQATQVRLEVGEKPIEGPTAHLFGSVMVDGRLAEGARVMGWIENRRFTAEVDRAGRFDLGVVPAGDAWINIQSKGGMFDGGSTIWQGNLKLAEAEEKDLRIEVMTSTMSGTVVTEDGVPVAGGGFVRAQGRIDSDSNLYLHAPVDDQGRFEFDNVAQGTWSLEVDGNGDEAKRGRLDGISVTAGVPVTDLRIVVLPAISVSGRVDMSMFSSGEKPQWVWIAVHQVAADGSLGDQVNGIGIDMDDGSFHTEELTVGTYGIRLHAGFEDRGDRYRCEDITVPPEGLKDLFLRGTKE
ncbi:MAG: carboxypeptidase regulatory-like domain-containing protein [Planctomycetes bacterium]|nr:carboxypeptidase regulatory-like domain-containing protein [Planctomycetota bacterium]